VLRSNLGNALRDAGQPAAAEKSYRRALKSKPDFADAHSNLASVLQARGRVEEPSNPYAGPSRCSLTTLERTITLEAFSAN